MTDSTAAARTAWVTRVLGVQLPEAGGQTAPGNAPAAIAERLSGLAQAVTQAVAAAAGDATSLRLKLGEAQFLARGGDEAGARSLLDSLDAALQATAAGQRTAPAEAAGTPLVRWQTARTVALATLRALEAAMRQSPSPDRDPAIILVRGLRANLTEKPETLAQVDDLLRYVEGDGIVEAAETPNVFGIKVDLRAPLTAALRELHATLGATLGAAP